MDTGTEVSCFVTDLDDTIWDWLAMWHSSFEPYLARIQKETGANRETLIADFMALHQKYGTTESSFVYQELNCLSDEQKELFERKPLVGKSILHEYYSNKKDNLKLYPGVLQFLQKLKSKGTLVIGFTESNAFFTKYRIKQLGLDGFFDCIYAPIDSGIPQGVERYYAEDYWEPQITEIRYLAKTVKKPAPDILEIILKDFGAKKDETIYVGDKLDKDVQMAKDCGIRGVHAKYGHIIDDDRYQLLRSVTHWTPEEVERERQVGRENKTKPIADFEIERNFLELERMFKFVGFGKKPSVDRAKEAIDVWKKVVDVQQHFNDIALRVRSLALTAFTFVIGGIGYTEKEHLTFHLFGRIVPYSSALAFLGLIILSAFFFMDRGWYHKFLVGAVKQGILIENRWSKYYPEMGLSNSIKNESPNRVFGKKISSNRKFWIFYGMLAFTLLALGLVLFFSQTQTPLPITLKS